MQKENFKEYELVREEMLQLKSCITNYIGFVLGGSGLVLAGSTTLFMISKENAFLGIAFLLLTILISMVLSVLFYKFNSHNRFAGYCLLLNQEKYIGSKNGKKDQQFFAWEICVGRIRQRKSDDFERWNISKGGRLRTPLPTETIIKRKPLPIRIIAGFWLMCLTVFGKKKSTSWHYPLVVVMLFFFIEVIFTVIGSFQVIDVLGFKPFTYMHWTGCSLILVNAFSWLIFFDKLHSLMYGPTTIASFCWKFVPIRREYLEKQGISDYRILGSN